MLASSPQLKSIMLEQSSPCKVPLIMIGMNEILELSLFVFSAVPPHTRLTALCPGLPGSAGTRKVKPIWILLEQEIVSGSGISWACASLHLTPDR